MKISRIPRLILIVSFLIGLVSSCSSKPTPTATPTSTQTPLPAQPTMTPTIVPSPTPSTTPTPTPPVFIGGVDASFLQMIEDAGGLYHDNGVAKDALTIFRDHGVNYIRLRLWNAPLIGYNNLAYTLKMARRVKDLGMGLMIDFHYSDTWADPGKQYKPAAWAQLPFDQMVTAVHDYTRDVVKALKSQGTLPEMVQLGNEITNGMLWDDGRVGGSFDSNWPNLAALLVAGAKGVQDSLALGEKVKILLHVDNGGNNATCRWFLDHIVEQNVPFDLIGVSYYPWWHGSLADLENNLNDLAQRYQKPVLVVETGYPWTLANNDYTGNLVNLASQLLPEFPATVNGQRDFLLAEKVIIQKVPDGLGWGMVYWAGDDISTPRIESVWENAAFFDFKGNVLASLDVFKTP
jgi:arabinogalactan endo-1,4-beta-galactosidase